MGKDQEFLEAARNGNVVIVEKLLNSKAKRGGPLASLRRGPGSNVQDASGYSALHHAALNGHREIVALLLEHEASPNITDSKGSTPLHLAAWAGHSDIVRLLLTSGVRVTQINLRNKDNETALHCASQYGHTGVVTLLLKYDADPSFRNVRDETALDLAAQYGRLETVQALLQTHPELMESYRFPGVPPPKTSPLHAASRNGHRGVVEALLGAGFPVSYLTQTGTALHEASLCGKVDVVRRLLEAGVDVSLRDGRGFTALRLVQDLPTPVALDIATLIQNYALLHPDRGGYDDEDGRSTTGGMPFKFPAASFSPDSPYENVSLSSSSNHRDTHGRTSSSSTGADSFITLPRRRNNKSSRQSQRTDAGSENYEVPPPPRSLPWFQQKQRRAAGGEGRSSTSQSDLLDDNGDSPPMRAPVDHHVMSRSFDGRSLDFLSDAASSLDVAGEGRQSRTSAFSRSSRSRHSADQYLPMSSSSSIKISPNPPQKPPRKIQGMSANYESLPRSVGRNGKPRHATYYSVDPPPLSLPPLTKSRAPPPASYEMVYLARTGPSPSVEPQGDQQPAAPAPSPRFRIGSSGSSYVEMAGQQQRRQPSSYENVFPSSGNVDDDSIYDLPRELGGTKAYENVTFVNHCSSTSTPSSKSTPDSPSKIAANLPPTPDHPPPPAHLAEQSIHLRMRPLSEELKRTSRDIETETEEEVFLTLTRDPGPVSDSSGGSCSASLSTSDKSDMSADNLEEVYPTSEMPFEGLLRGSVPVNRSNNPERPNSLPARSCWTDNASKNGLRQSRTSLSVLSPFDEQEEWLKILEILNSCNSGLVGPSGEESNNLLGDVQRELQNRFDAMNGATPDDRPQDVIELPVGGGHPGDASTVADWLLSLGLQQYLGMFIANGFDDLDFLGDGILDDGSLMEIGVLDAQHRSQLTEAASLLATPLPKMNTASRPTNVDDWLHLLRLDHYAEQFRKNRFDDMERIERIWEVELTTVVEIRLVGHLRRMLSSLKRDANKNGPVQQPTVLYPVNQSEFSALSSDLQEISTNIAKLGDEIGQKMANGTANNTTGTLGRRKSRPPPPPPSISYHQASYQALEAVLDGLAVRNPSELVIGIAKTVATQWRHQPHQLLRPGVRYDAQYLGSTRVRHVRGTESTKRSIQKLKKKHAEDSGGSKSTGIVLAISLSGVQFLDPATQEAICKHDIRNINWACQDADDLTHFAYITKDQDSPGDEHFCHVFQVPTMDLATEVILTLGQAFEVAYQLVLREDLVCSPVLSKAPVGTSQPTAPTSITNQPSLSAAPQATPAAPGGTSKTKPRPIGPKPTVLPPKPKLGTALLHSKTSQHARSHSSIDAMAKKTIADARLQSESNLAGLAAAANTSSSVSVSSNGSGRAPLAAKDEL